MPTALVLGPDDHGRPLTLEEFESARWQDGYQYELIDGKLYVSPVPDLPHDQLLKWVYRLLDDYSEEQDEVINYVSSHARVFLPDRPEATQPQPDVAAYRDFPQDRPIRDVQWQDVSPVLVVEVVSEDDPEKDLERNVELYEQVPSIREYWILEPGDDPDRPSLTVYRRRGRRWQRPIEVAAGETYTTRLLPGFELLVDPHG
jgi:Uma2 family endonuclease